VDDLAWRKAAACNPEGSCVELAALPDGNIAMRNSRDPHGPRLVFTQAEIAAFIDGAKEGEFDDFLSEDDGAYLAVFIRPARDLAGTG
jgi:hypothetical protein